ncbi:50S ribosomal protein L9 [Algihabitans albus]|uniref:50S ribosomal protein L9 n=1 Tax=Algihabitans albus TaxID=2164067 RepID=UPI000E5CDBED|nr:50S ribosomal protein L9 [Algihabitans albus]
MEVILLERIEKLGQMGDVVRVKPGFARNFLLPQRKALRATKENLSYFESQRTHLEAENLKRRDEAAAVAKKIDHAQVILIRQAGETGQLYGSVSSRDLADAIRENGITVARGQIVLDRPIKTLGLHDIRVRLHPEVSVTITANIARSNEEAETQAATGEAFSAEEQEEALAAAEAALEEQIEAADEDVEHDEEAEGRVNA